MPWTLRTNRTGSIARVFISPTANVHPDAILGDECRIRGNSFVGMFAVLPPGTITHNETVGSFPDSSVSALRNIRQESGVQHTPPAADMRTFPLAQFWNVELAPSVPAFPDISPYDIQQLNEHAQSVNRRTGIDRTAGRRSWLRSLANLLRIPGGDPMRIVDELSTSGVNENFWNAVESLCANQQPHDVPCFRRFAHSNRPSQSETTAPNPTPIPDTIPAFSYPSPPHTTTKEKATTMAESTSSLIVFRLKRVPDGISVHARVSPEFYTAIKAAGTRGQRHEKSGVEFRGGGWPTDHLCNNGNGDVELAHPLFSAAAATAEGVTVVVPTSRSKEQMQTVARWARDFATELYEQRMRPLAMDVTVTVSSSCAATQTGADVKGNVTENTGRNAPSVVNAA